MLPVWSLIKFPLVEGTSHHTYSYAVCWLKGYCRNNTTSAKTFHVTKKGDKRITPDNPGKNRVSITRHDRPHSKRVCKSGGQWAGRAAHGVLHFERFNVAIVKGVVEPALMRFV